MHEIFSDQKIHFVSRIKLLHEINLANRLYRILKSAENFQIGRFDKFFVDKRPKVF